MNEPNVWMLPSPPTTTPNVAKKDKKQFPVISPPPTTTQATSTQSTSTQATSVQTEILTELRFIADIKPSDKLCYNNNTINIDNSYFPSISRWWNKYNRNETVDALDTIYSNTFNIIEKLIKDNKENKQTVPEYRNLDFIQELIKCLDNSMNGLISLKMTYTEDKYILSRLDTLIKKINIRKQYATEHITLNS